MLAFVRNRLGKMFNSGYDAVDASGKRRKPSTVLKSSDDALKGRHRQQLVSTGQHLARNFSLVAWAVRKHLDYCTQFEFQMRTDDDGLNAEVEQMFAEWSRPQNCDAAGRHPFARMLRMLEARRTIDGDVFAIKRSTGRLQIIEGDRIRQPSDMPSGQMWKNGCQVNRDGRSLRWAIHDRTSNGGYEFRRNVLARDMLQHSFFDRFDQVRGISPLAAAYNSFQDAYEGIDYALAKLKVEQLFAMIITSAAADGIGEHTGDSESGYEVDFGRGPIKLEMDDGDDAKFLKSDNPGSNTQDFLHSVLAIALKSLDLPFNFYDESHTNFFGSRAAWLLYDRSCQSKRADIVELLRRITVWRMQLWLQDRELTLPRGMTLADVPFEWVHRGMPWWDPVKEINGDLLAIGAGLDNPYRVTKERGRGEFEDNIKQIARAKEFAESQGVTLSFAMNSMPDSEDEE